MGPYLVRVPNKVILGKNKVDKAGAVCGRFESGQRLHAAFAMAFIRQTAPQDRDFGPLRAKPMNQSTQTEREFAARIKRYIDIVGSLDFDDDVVVSYLLSERNHQTDAAVIVHLDEWIALIEQGKRARAYAEALTLIARLERGTARLK